MNNSLSTGQSESQGRNCVIVTRPRAQLKGLMDRLAQRIVEEKLDCELLGLPLLEIEALGDSSLAKDLNEALSSADLIVFVSPNAVISAKDLLSANQYVWPQGCVVGVVGGGTEQSIKDSGLMPKELIKPAASSSWDSEGLWAALNTPGKKWAGKRVTFVKGRGGRPWLMDQLTQQGAQVQAFEVYRRTPLAISDSAWAAIANVYQATQNQPIWLLTSSEAVYQIPNALEKLGLPIDSLKRSQSISSHHRIMQAAQEVGFGDVKLCEAGDLNLADATIALLRSTNA